MRRHHGRRSVGDDENAVERRLGGAYVKRLRMLCTSYRPRTARSRASTLVVWDCQLLLG
jgi:hypothetical protein